MKNLSIGPHFLVAPPTRPIYLTLLASIPCLIFVALSHQGDLTPTVASIVLSGMACICFALPVIQKPTQKWLRKEFEYYRHNISIVLADPSLTEAERAFLLSKDDCLQASYQLVNGPEETYRKRSTAWPPIQLPIRPMAPKPIIDQPTCAGATPATRFRMPAR